MKKLITVITLMISAFTIQAQETAAKEIKTVTLEQTTGEFTQKSVTLSPGTYMFEIVNSNVESEVGFVLAPKGKTGPENHIKSAYVTKAVATNTTGHSKMVTLEKGEYVYFCPLNKTPEYTLIVE